VTRFPSHLSDDFDALIALLRARGVRDLRLDSRQIERGDAFVAIPGRNVDGRQFIEQAAARGAAAVLVEADGWTSRHAGVPVLPLAGLSADLGRLAAAWYGEPSRALFSVGVTGTNGKTSCTQWIAQALSAGGRPCGVIGTLGSGFPEQMHDAGLTTPDPVSLQRTVRALADRGARALAMEVSSIGLDQQRVDGMKFDVAVFTNLTRDHLDYHGTMEAYAQAKARLFDWPTLTHVVLNLDDPCGRQLAHVVQARVRPPKLIGYSLAAVDHAGVPCLLRATALRVTASGLAFTLIAGDEHAEVAVGLVGTFNVSNLLAVTGALLAAGLPLGEAAALLPRLRPPPGRMQCLGGSGQPLAVVDYAHTPDALAQALAALRPLAQARSGALWVVFGAGGDRDPGKRAPMGAAAAAADRVVITSDNPRGEEPAAIAAQIAAGVPVGAYCRTLIDRGTAIDAALAEADARDVVLIAGKGHEPYQESRGVRTPFSDVERANAALALRGSREPAA
jgi:UDP-N-acetylmuramoyl-L-alanyl-D-glutamate--2,6-diaminopimelate ligase